MCEDGVGTDGGDEGHGEKKYAVGAIISLQKLQRHDSQKQNRITRSGDCTSERVDSICQMFVCETMQTKLGLRTFYGAGLISCSVVHAPEEE